MDSTGIRAVAFNALTAAMSQTAWLRLSDRERLSAAVADAVEPLVRDDEAAQFWAVAKDFPEPFRSLIAEVAGRHALPQEDDDQSVSDLVAAFLSGVKGVTARPVSQQVD